MDRERWAFSLTPSPWRSRIEELTTLGDVRFRKLLLQCLVLGRWWKWRPHNFRSACHQRVWFLNICRQEEVIVHIPAVLGHWGGLLKNFRMMATHGHRPLKTPTPARILPRLLLLAHLAQNNSRRPGFPWCFLKRMEDPGKCARNPNASRCHHIANHSSQTKAWST